MFIQDNKEKQILIQFVGDVMLRSNLSYKKYQIYNLDEFDGKRIYIALDNGDFDYTIVLWSIKKEYIRFTLFKNEDEEIEDKYEDKDAEEIISGQFTYSVRKGFNLFM